MEIDPSSAVGTGGFDAANYCITYVKGKLTILPPQFDTVPNNMTDSSLMCFDTDTNLPGRQFNLIYQQDSGSTYTLNSSNPGQFYENILYVGTPHSTVSLKFQVPYPFVTQGANPIHVYSDVTVTGSWPCIGFVPGPDITPNFTRTSNGAHSPFLMLGETIGGAHDIGVSYGEITVTGEVPASGLLYANVHLDYGFKRTPGWSRLNNTIDASNPNPGNVGAPATLHGAGLGWLSGQPYTLKGFKDVGNGFEQLCGPNNVCQDTIYSLNIFKKSVGAAGVVTDGLLMPLSGAEVRMYTDPSRLPQYQVGITAITDTDGAYYINYKHTGSARQYYLRAIYGAAPAQDVTITLKANGFSVTNFVFP
jgi:hypothetical protein